MTTTTYPYFTADGAPYLRVQRIDNGNGSKKMWQERPNGSGWEKGGRGGPHPIYRLRTLDTPGKVIVVEGEKCVHAIVDRWGDKVCVTWLGGTAAVDRTDWSPITNRDVTIIPDDDAPGREAANQIADRLTAQGCAVEMVITDGDTGDDVADWINNNTLDDMLAARFLWEAPEPDKPRSWTDVLVDDRIAVNAGDPIPKPRTPDLAGLFYSGLSNAIGGTPDTGKSFIALRAAAEAHTSGRVVWLDAEDSTEAFSQRCLLLGCTELTRSPDVRRINHEDWADCPDEYLQQCWEWLGAGFGAGLIIIDSGTASGTGDSLDQWRTWAARHLPDKNAGIGVILVAHLVKDPEQRHNQLGGSRGIGGWARGMIVLIDEYDGTGWAPGTDTEPPKPGGYGLTISKNKPGGNRWVKHQRIGTLWGEPHDDGTLTVSVVTGGQALTLADAVAAYVADNPGKKTTEVAEHIPGEKPARNNAIIKAEERGLIIRVPGSKGAKLCYPPGHPATLTDTPQVLQV